MVRLGLFVWGAILEESVCFFSKLYAICCNFSKIMHRFFSILSNFFLMNNYRKNLIFLKPYIKTMGWFEIWMLLVILGFLGFPFLQVWQYFTLSTYYLYCEVLLCHSWINSNKYWAYPFQKWTQISFNRSVECTIPRSTWNRTAIVSNPAALNHLFPQTFQWTAQQTAQGPLLPTQSTSGGGVG